MRLAVASSVESTQTAVVERLKAGRFPFDGLLASTQTAGRGRHGRSWFSPPGTCLAVTLVLRRLSDPPKPELVGMAVGLCVAEVLDCRIAWPNDLMLGGRKVGGVLSELISVGDARVPVVGIGVNLTVSEFPPELADGATSFSLEGRLTPPPDVLADQIWRALEAVKAPAAFSEIAARWQALDATPGKAYILPDGRQALAERVSPDGELVATAGGETVVVPSAEAGVSPPSR